MNARKKIPRKTGSKTRRSTSGKGRTGGTGRENADKYRQLVELTNTGFVILDERGRVLDANQVYVRMAGHESLDEILGRPVTDWTATYDRERNAAEVAKCLATGAVSNLVIDYVHASGDVVPVEINAAVQLGPGPPRILTVCRDFTEPRKIEQTMRDSEERMRGLVETSTAWIWETDADIRHTYTNAFVTTVLGYRPEEFLRLDVRSLLHPDDQPLLNQLVTGAIAQREAWSGRVLRWRHKDGSWRHIESSGAPFFDRQGTFAGLRGVDRDVTDRTRAEEKLRHMHELMQYVISHAQSAIAVHDRDMRYIYVSDNYLKQYGVKEKDVIGKHHYEVFPDLPQKWRDVHQRVLQGAVEGKDEDPYVREDGTTDWTRWSCLPWYERDGSIGGLIVYTEVITGRMRAESELRESEARLRTVTENAPDTILQVDRQGVITYINRTMPGVTMAQVVGTHVSQWVPRELHPVVARALEQVFATGQRQEYESPGPGPNGEARFYSVRVMPVVSGGRAESAIYIARDITERKRAEEALRDTERSMTSIVDSIPVGMHRYRLDPDGRLVFVGANRTADRILGVDNSRFIGMTIEEAFPALKGTGVPERYRDVALTGRMWLTENIEYHEGAISGAFEVHAFQTAPNNMVAAFEDITVRKRAEEALKENKRSLEVLMGNLPGMVYRCRNDRTWTMEYVSEGAAALTGYQPADLVGNAVIAYNDLIHPDDQDAVWNDVQQAIATRRKFTLNYRIRRADGQERWVWEQGQGMFSDAGELVSLEGFITDVNDSRLLAEERLKMQKLESIGTLAGGIAHDFNNLLQGVFGYIAMAKLTFGQPERSYAMLEQAEKALHQSVNLTSQLLTFAKGGKPVKRRVDLRPVIENAVKFALSGSRTDFRIDIVPDLWQADADEGQLGQVIQNIALNADQAMPLGGTIEIGAWNIIAPGAGAPQTLKPGRYVAIRITDSGIGIPEHFLPRIFDPYFTTKEKGSGLGLATSYSIIRNHDGLIDVQSAVGRGSTFTLYLPAVPGRVEEPRREPAAAAPARRGSILVMDDEEIVRTVAGELIRSLGHAADFAEHGARCIEKYRQAREAGKAYDVVILDLTIRGGMGGLETLQELRRIDPAVTAVVSSGYSDDMMPSEYVSRGFKAFLKKPYDLGSLKDVLNRLMT